MNNDKNDEIEYHNFDFHFHIREHYLCCVHVFNAGKFPFFTYVHRLWIVHYDIASAVPPT